MPCETKCRWTRLAFAFVLMVAAVGCGSSLQGGGRVTIRGELANPAQAIRGLINQGSFGVTECLADPDVALPRFVLHCPTDAKDSSAWLEVAAFPPGRILGDIVFVSLVWPAGRASDAYVSPSADMAAPVSNSNDLAAALVPLINNVRAKAGLPALTLAPEESQTATRLAPHLFAALAGLLPETLADTIVLGLRAGWDIPETIRYGQIMNHLTPYTTDAGRWLSEALERPGVRNALLDPEVSRMAIGPLVADNSQILAAVISTYALFDHGRFEQWTLSVADLINKLRSAKGLPPLRAMAEFAQPMSQVVNAVEQGRIDPKDALSSMMERIGQSSHRSVRGWVVQGSKLEELQWPDDIVRRPVVESVVGVTFYKPQSEPWGRYVVFIVMAEPDMQAI